MADDLGTPAEDPFRPTAVDLRDYVEFELDMPTARRIMATDVLALDLVCLEPQQTLPARTFETADAVYTVLGGMAWVVTDETEVTLAPLQAVMIPAGVPHGLRNNSPDPLILQVVTSPPDDVPVVPPGPAPQAAAEREAQAARPRRIDRLRRTLGSG
ncbi:hypothetical protein BH23ACT9_BH23ACT9_29310 [soil metagenome]